jgi:hypothetical protein
LLAEEEILSLGGRSWICLREFVKDFNVPFGFRCVSKCLIEEASEKIKEACVALWCFMHKLAYFLKSRLIFFHLNEAKCNVKVRFMHIKRAKTYITQISLVAPLTHIIPFSVSISI